MAPAKKNQLILDYDDQKFYCEPCNRFFTTAQGALSHCRTASVHSDEWCESCQRLFVSSQALSSHLQNAFVHIGSASSDGDYSDSEESETQESEIFYKSRYSEPIHPRGYTSPPSYQQYRTHQAQSIECYGCYEEFGRLSGMMMHLESSACECRVDLHDIDEWAFRSRQSYEYTTSWQSYDKYKCPTCDARFRVLSALIQHIEVQNCGQRLQGSVRSMLDFIKRKLTTG